MQPKAQLTCFRILAKIFSQKCNLDINLQEYIYMCVDSLLSDYLIFQEKLETWNIN